MEHISVNKGNGNSMMTYKDVKDTRTAELYLLSLTETVRDRLRADSMKIGLVVICILFNELWDENPIRHKYGEIYPAK